MTINLEGKPLAYQIYWRDFSLTNYVHGPPCNHISKIEMQFPTLTTKEF